jgi:hypothetical protein
MQHIPSSEADSSLTNQEISTSFMEPLTDYRVKFICLWLI